MEPLSWALWSSSATGRSSRSTPRWPPPSCRSSRRGMVGWIGRVRRRRHAGAGRGAADPRRGRLADRRPDGLFTRSGAFTPFTALSNVTGQPAISLPLYEHEGLPVGVHLIGRPAQEGALLALATQLERALPWADRARRCSPPSPSR